MADQGRRAFLAGGAGSCLGLALASARSGRARADTRASATSAAPAPATPTAPTAPKTGGIRMITVDGKYKVWTKKVGAGAVKLLTLHGGPGCTHEYFECFEDFLPQNGVEFYYYDQLGSAYSEQ